MRAQLLCALALLCGAAIAAPTAAPATWTRGGAVASISVDSAFAYNLTVKGSSACDLAGGALVFHCGGVAYSTAAGQ